MAIFLKNPFKYFMIVAQLLSMINALYTTVSEIDDDPEIQELWRELKTEPVLAVRAAMMRMQFDAIVDLVKQLKK